MFEWIIKMFKKAPTLPIEKIKNPLNRILITAKNRYAMGNSLNGCVNDCKLWFEYLTSIGFDESCFYIMLNELSTYAQEVKALQWLSECKGPYAIYINSSHGIISNGHEATCSYDFNWGKESGTSISSVNIEDVLSAIPKATKLIIVSDSCHSQNDRLKSMIKGRSKALDNPNPNSLSGTPKSISDSMLDCTYLAACLADETASDAYIKDNYNGAFTYYLIQVLKEGVNPNATELMERTNKYLRENGYSQHATIQGVEKADPLF